MEILCLEEAMPFAPSRPNTLEIICLQPGCMAPPDAHWINLSPVIDGAWMLDGSVPIPPGTISRYGEYRSALEAVQTALEFAMQQGCPLVYVEIDARRCARW